MLGSLAARLRAWTKHHTFRYGLPMITLLVGGSFGLKEFTQLRYHYRKITILTKEEEEALEQQLKKPEDRTNLHKELKKLKESDLDNWQNIRGPRPWEDSKAVQDTQREAINKA
eukprot:GHVU01114737.1.p1 GENE.GHVU01114737.1~~GHVU01114737.1.p1  ORF type:complete len:114 (+),score=14.12 GHVU01114737.1:112-453(+)